MTTFGFLIDLDGVVYLNGEPFPGVVSALQRMQTEGIPFRFVSNNTHRSKRSIADHLLGFGVAVPVAWIFTPIAAAVRYLQDAGADSCWFLGSPDAAGELREAGINPADPGAAQPYRILPGLSDIFTLMQ